MTTCEHNWAPSKMWEMLPSLYMGHHTCTKCDEEKDFGMVGYWYPELPKED